MRHLISGEIDGDNFNDHSGFYLLSKPSYFIAKYAKHGSRYMQYALECITHCVVVYVPTRVRDKTDWNDTSMAIS